MSKVLVVGRGGREHALAWKFSKCPTVSRVYVAPGNCGMTDVAETVAIDENDAEALVAFARAKGIDLTVIGPEVPLVNGIADRFEREGLAVFGPKAEAAIIEGSKSFAKDLMRRHGIPTAGYRVFDDHALAERYIEDAPMPTVIKADGLAAGKGVVIAQTRNEARTALREMMLDGRFGEASRAVVIEEFLVGEEFSYIALVHGETVVPMELARDHKRARDGDAGPNTGGMGAYSPASRIDRATVETATRDILEKTARAMVEEGRPFSGFLYAGLIACADGPKVIEFNARMGDPETQALMPRLESDLFAAITHLLKGGRPSLEWSSDAAVAVVLASEGYPGAYVTGFPIEGLDNPSPDALVFHCGTALADGRTVTAGGRVLTVAARAPTFEQARTNAYAGIDRIKCGNLFYRRDIGGNR